MDQPVDTRPPSAGGPSAADRARRPSRKLFRTIGILFLFLGFILSPVFAGPNEGGKLILHAQPSLIASGSGNLCGWSDLRDAKEAVTEVPADQNKLVVFFVLAAFPDYAMPRLMGLAFGIDYTSSQLAPAWGSSNSCGYYVEPTSDWPGDGSGVQILFHEPLTDRLSEICWFACYAWAGNTFKVAPHPNALMGGVMADDTIPAQWDQIEDYGMIGFGTRGYNPCSTEQALGACCDAKGQCVQQTRVICASFGAGSTFVGENEECLPNPCTPGMGACCHRGDCLALSWDDCIHASGTFMGQSSSCSPTPCIFGELETSWGALKQSYLGQ